MSQQNVITPSAPPSIYPQLEGVAVDNNSQGDFRLRKICDCQSELKKEITHYERVLKKYKKARSVTHNSSNFVSMTLSALLFGVLAISLSGVGAIVGVRLSSVTALMGFVAVGFGIAGKKLTERFLNMKK